MILRDYQQDDIAEIRALLKNSRSVLWQLPTGGGKTAGAAYMIGGAIQRQVPAWFVVHRRELVKQSRIALRAAGVQHGVIAAGEPYDPRPLAHVCAIDTLRRRIGKVRPPKLIVWDEVHHLGARTWAEVYDSQPQAVHIGLSATPGRTDGAGLSRFFKHMVCGPSTAELIERGYLAPYKLFAPQIVDMTETHTRGGEYVKAEAPARVTPTVTGDAVTHYLKHARGKRALVFCVSVEDSKLAAAKFRAAGISARSIDGSMDDDLRDELIRGYGRGDPLVLTNCRLVSEGFNLEGIEVLIDLSPTLSLIEYLQKIGRVMRSFPGKIAYIFDHVGNWQRHGLPDDPRDWSLEGHQGRRKNGPSEPANRQCRKCYAVFPMTRQACPECGAIHEVRARKIEQADGELAEVDLEAAREAQEQARIAKRQEQGMAKSLEELIAFARRNGYKKPEWWAMKVFGSRPKEGKAA